MGGIATMAHGATRPTKDFDCLPRTTVENLDRLGAALSELGARFRAEGVDDETARQMTPPLDARFFSTTFVGNFRTDAGDLDVLLDMADGDGTRRTYDDLATRAIPITIDGIVVRIAALEDIIASKQHANRVKDREALPELYQLAKEARERRSQ